MTLRTVCPDDDAFLAVLYASTRDDLGALGLPADQAEALVTMQHQAQRRHYEAVYPDADHAVVEVDGTAAGRLIVDRGADQVLIVDVALLPDHRDQGVGTVVVEALLREADDSGVPTRCHVALDNPARRFWERLGFTATGVDGAHIAMERTCPTSAS